MRTDEAAKAKKPWLRFKTIKAAVTIGMVLSQYDVVNFKMRNLNEFFRKCPLPKCPKATSKKSFTINVKTDSFICTSCQSHGNVIDFVSRKEKCSLLEAAWKIVSWYKTQPGEPSPDIACGNCGSKDIALPIKGIKGYFSDCRQCGSPWFAALKEDGASKGEIEETTLAPSKQPSGFYDQVELYEIDLIKEALRKTGGHQSKAARLLDMHPTTLNSKIKHYQISLE